eukprot:3260155-Prymnesium_polylepis.1
MFFSCDYGATPPELLRRGIYGQIAVALKGGEWRKTSMAMIAKAFAGSDAVGKEDAKELESTQAMSKAVQQELNRMPTRAHAAASIAARGRAAAKPLAGRVRLARLISGKRSKRNKISRERGSQETAGSATALDLRSSV